MTPVWTTPALIVANAPVPATPLNVAYAVGTPAAVPPLDSTSIGPAVSHVPNVNIGAAGAAGSGAVVLTAVVSAKPKNEATESTKAKPVPAEALMASARTSPIMRAMLVVRTNDERDDDDGFDIYFIWQLSDCGTKVPLDFFYSFTKVSKRAVIPRIKDNAAKLQFNNVLQVQT